MFRSAGWCWLLVVAWTVTACGEDPLAGLGSYSGEWVEAPAPSPQAGPSPTTVQDDAETVMPVARVAWENDGLGASGAQTPDEVLVAVGARGGTDAERLIQASRFEIAAALPGVEFPGLVPAGVVSVTSQLNLAADGQRLDDETFVSFGLWTVEPYSRSRSVGQRGTLTVGPAPADGSGPDCETSLAPDFCVGERVAGLPTARLDATIGPTWVWDQGKYRYSLFLRGGVGDNLPTAEAMIASKVSLVELAPDQAG